MKNELDMEMVTKLNDFFSLLIEIDRKEVVTNGYRNTENITEVHEKWLTKKRSQKQKNEASESVS